jgi:hypothetical protein
MPPPNLLSNSRSCFSFLLLPLIAFPSKVATCVMLMVLEPTDDKQSGSVIYLCRCDCGGSVYKSRAGIMAAKAYRNHCGCLTKNSRGRSGGTSLNQPHIVVESFGKAMRHRFTTYVRNAEVRGLKWELSIDKFLILTKGDCSYCGSSPSQTHKVPGSAVFVYNGIDRIDNTLGYIDFNCVSCCGICNSMKGILSKEEFLKHCKVIANYSC